MKLARATVAQTSKSAVSRVSKPAEAATGSTHCRLGSRRHSGLGNLRYGQHAFTMVEVALSLAIIAFALAAILGVLPTGANMQRDNRENTIINQEGTFWLEAIRSGTTNLDEMTNYVDQVQAIYTGGPNAFANLDSREIVGLLTVPTPNVLRTEATVRAITGSAAEKGSPVAFRYQLTSQVIPFTTVTNSLSADEAAVQDQLQNNLHEVRLTLRWPVLPNGDTGNGKQVFRAMVGGRMEKASGPSGNTLFFFRNAGNRIYAPRP